MDLSILKDFHLGERHSLEFRAEMLNFINHANFALQQQNLAGRPGIRPDHRSSNSGCITGSNRKEYESNPGSNICD
jgi:hypothetical protein